MKRKMRSTDVIIIGAGSAGLAAIDEIKKKTDRYILIDHGPLGTTCARSGCMPSKSLISIANELHHARRSHRLLRFKNPMKQANTAVALEHVRRLRRYFVTSVVRSMPHSKQHFVRGTAQFINAQMVSVNGQLIRAKTIIVATGSSPTVPREWQHFKKDVLTSENIFELKALPASVAVMGAGPLGLEMAQALSRLGVIVDCYNQGATIGGLSDPLVLKEAKRLMRLEFRLHLSTRPRLKRAGRHIEVTTGTKVRRFEKILASIGRSPNTDSLNLKAAGVKIAPDNRVPFSERTRQVQRLPLFIAGDAAADRPILHESIWQGMVAGHNACNPIRQFKPKTRVNIIFTEPSIAVVGRNFASLKDENFVVGETKFKNEGRALILGTAGGLLRIYAKPKTGEILGAEMICPEAEHLAHMLVFAIENKVSVGRLCALPIYHPTVEELLRSALRSITL